jgi:hypothetical protein
MISLFYRIFLNFTSSAFCNGRIDFEPVLYELVILEVIVAQDNQFDFPWIQSIILYKEEIWPILVLPQIPIYVNEHSH